MCTTLCKSVNWQLLTAHFNALDLGDKYHLHSDEESGFLDFKQLLSETHKDSLIYTCGPEGMLNALMNANQNHELHYEKFSASSDQQDDENSPFKVKVNSTGKIYDISADDSILGVLTDDGIDIPFACTSGVCGTCITDVLEGDIDHRDEILSDEEKASNEYMCGIFYNNMTTMHTYKDFWYTSNDNLRLYARDYSKALEKNPDAKTILCMHGLTRNSADFEDICNELADDFRLIVVDQRGREKLELSSVILLGTSMGGIMAMMMTAMKPDLIDALIINDVGPEIAPQGLDRLKKYVGKQAPVNNWEEAAKQTEAINRIAFPDATNEDWLKFAKRLYREDENGRPVIACDPNIAIPLANTDESDTAKSAAPDLWPVYDQIVDKPMLVNSW
ncbi:Tetrachlorobenzoquinone reductase [Nymphon striatum]|nr:Tetrachlorobenzoquinone reductase [Nymphon striatum]